VSNHKVALYAENSKFEYLGKHSEPLAAKKYILGFMEKGEKRIKLLELRDNFSIQQLIKAEGGTSTEFGMNTDIDHYAHKQLLVDELGTKKSQKILKQMKNKVIKDSAIHSVGEIKELFKKKGEQLREEQVDEDSERFQQELANRRKYLPDFNYSAKTASKIYNSKSLISEKDWGLLDLHSLGDKKRIHQYVNDTLRDQDEKLQGPDGGMKKKQMLYLSYLLTVFRNREISVNLNELSDQLGIPFEIMTGIIGKFFEQGESKTDSKRYIRSKSMELKMSCHILVLA
jgi:hypothetical protein